MKYPLIMEVYLELSIHELNKVLIAEKPKCRFQSRIIQRLTLEKVWKWIVITLQTEVYTVY